MKLENAYTHNPLVAKIAIAAGRTSHASMIQQAFIKEVWWQSALIHTQA